MPRQTLTFLTPCFCGGAENKTGPAELRVPSLRGQLRYWTRVLFHVPGKPDEGARKEHELFGGIRAKDLGFKHPVAGQQASDAIASRFTFRLAFRPPSPTQASQPLCPHDPTKGWRSALPPGARFDLEWDLATSSGRGNETDLGRVFKTWVLLGTLGARGTRAAGSVWRAGWAPGEQEFLDVVNSVWPNHKLPDFLKVKVLRLPTQVELDAWHPPVRSSPHDWLPLQTDDAERLRAIATDLVELRIWLRVSRRGSESPQDLALETEAGPVHHRGEGRASVDCHLGQSRWPWRPVEERHPRTGQDQTHRLTPARRKDCMNSAPAITWRISSEPAALTREEFRARYDHPHTPEKFEVCAGKLFWHDDQRLVHCHSAFRIPHSAFERAVRAALAPAAAER